jgi:hypothetical protein
MAVVKIYYVHTSQDMKFQLLYSLEFHYAKCDPFASKVISLLQNFFYLGD